jgi:hypothetical protein
MAEILPDKFKGVLGAYLSQVRTLPNETAKRERFAALLGELYPASKKLMDYAAGAETSIRFDIGAEQKKGRIDTYYGNAVIEFEASLKATGKHAEEQLRNYVAGVWAKEGTKRPLIAISSDGVAWRTYKPSLKGKPTAENVALDQIREFSLTDATLGEFWLWLTIVLFRPAQLHPTAQRFRQDFGATSPAFQYSLDALAQAWRDVRSQKEPGLAFNTWKRYLTVTYGSTPASQAAGEGEISELEHLFLKHTYLASVARLLIWASFSRGKATGDLRTVASQVLSGEYFQALKLANLVEDDFFQWVRRAKAEGVLAPVWERLLVQMGSYDLSALGEDVLKGVYQELVDPADRHELGEFYTPDWLCEVMVGELLPAKGMVSALDPACGSGSFLRALIAHLRRANPSGGDDERLQGILDHVVGIDIHPLAVTISRATYVLALGPLVRAAKRPIYLPVYLADSLFLPTEVRQADLVKGGGLGYEVRFGNRKIIMPNSLVTSADLFDRSIAASAKVAMDHAGSKAESRKSLSAYLSKEVEGFAQHAERDDLLEALWQFTDELADLIRSKENSIWAFIVRNGYRPAMLRARFDFVVGNPPWLSYRYIQDPDYQDEVKKRAVDEYKIAPTHQKLFTQMELATVFLVHALTVFGRKNSRLGFVMPRSVLSSDQHMNLRARSYSAPLRLTAYWDLWGVEPLFNVPACVLFAQRDEASRGSIKDALPIREWGGRLPARDVPWSVAEKTLTYSEKTSRVIFLGDRTAFSTEEGAGKPTEPSRYAGRFRQGATLVPRNFYFVRVKDLKGKPSANALYWAETDPEQAEDAKPPYKDLKFSGQVEGRFLLSTALARHVLPFAVLPPATVVLPVERGVNAPYVRKADELKKDGYREVAAWMARAEKMWKLHNKKGKAGKQTIYERLDFQKELTSQDMSDRHLVLYNAAGTNLVAAHLDREELILPFIVDHKTYWAACDSGAEADYLAAVLNANAVNKAIKPFQSVGLMGEREIHQKVLDLPIPKYKGSEASHRDLAALGAKARAEAAKLVADPAFPASLAQRRAWLRGQLADLLARVDDIVSDLF